MTEKLKSLQTRLALSLVSVKIWKLFEQESYSQGLKNLFYDDGEIRVNFRQNIRVYNILFALVSFNA